jgi:hypothetical protein
MRCNLVADFFFGMLATKRSRDGHGVGTLFGNSKKTSVLCWTHCEAGEMKTFEIGRKRFVDE